MYSVDSSRWTCAASRYKCWSYIISAEIKLNVLTDAVRRTNNVEHFTNGPSTHLSLLLCENDFVFIQLRIEGGKLFLLFLRSASVALHKVVVGAVHIEFFFQIV